MLGYPVSLLLAKRFGLLRITVLLVPKRDWLLVQCGHVSNGYQPVLVPSRMAVANLWSLATCLIVWLVPSTRKLWSSTSKLVTCLTRRVAGNACHAVRLEAFWLRNPAVPRGKA
jgi:hypothetical protein